MEREEFEAAFLEFISGEAYRKAEQAILSLACTAFSSGWCAARYPVGPADEAPQKTDTPLKL